MTLLAGPYALVILFFGGGAFWNGEIALGFAIIGSAYLALGSGISARRLFKSDLDAKFDNRKQSLLIALLATLMLAASVALVHYFEITFGTVSGFASVLVGIAIGCFADMSQHTQEEDAEPGE